VAVLGGGIAGANAARVAAGVGGAEVTILDVNPTRLRYLGDLLGGRVTTLMSNRATLEEEVLNADLVIGTVLVAGARTPRLVTRAMVDLSIDQGGLSETSRPTSHRRPIYVAQGVVHYCVTNMPAIVPHTSTYALTNATLTYALELADLGVLEAGARNAALRNGVNTFGGHVVHPAVAAALRIKPRSPWD
jgi:alanine dehydrogenase